VDQRVTVLAVGDDDQNVYHWRGSNVAFLRQFESDYQAKRVSLVENYRSTAHIITAANQLIGLNADRMKVDMPIRIDTRRAQTAPGGRFEALDATAQGRVRVLHLSALVDQPASVVSELLRLRACEPDLPWERCAILAPTHASLDAVRGLCEAKGIPVRHRVDRDRAFSLYRLRDVQTFLDYVDAHPTPEVDAATLRLLLARLFALRPGESALELVAETVRAFIDDAGEHWQPKPHVREFFGEVLLEQRRERTLGEGVMLGTVHGSKGAEYDHVIVLAGGWRPREDDTMEARRRLHYVGMTRARQTLTILDCAADGSVWRWPEAAVGTAGAERAAQGAFHHTRVAPCASESPGGERRYEVLSLSDLYLGFAGNTERHAQVDAAVARLVTGDPLRLTGRGHRLYLEDETGERVGALSNDASERWRERLPRVVRARVAAIIVRRLEDEPPAFQGALARRTWAVVIPELVTEPRAAV
jgi:ATP-dependent DNA helicase RecQ